MQEIQKRALPLNLAYPFGAELGLQAEMNEIRNMEIEWDLKYTSSVRRGFIVDLFEKRGILSSFKERYWPSGLTSWGDRKCEFYLGLKSQYEDFLLGRDSEDLVEDVEPLSEEQQFAAETDLRDFLAKNLERIEPGLRLFQQEGRTGVEFSIDGGRIDILAVDQDNKFVVIELKLSRGRNRTLGQLLYYMGWVDENLGNAPCRGMIIAKNITDDLITAVKRISDVSLLAYSLSVTVKRIH